MKRYDAVVIGGGPAGLTSALYLCRAGVHAAMVEMMGPGGQVLRTSQIDNYPGFPKGISGWELADLFDAHLVGFPLDRYIDIVTSFIPQDDYHLLTLGEEQLAARTVIVCTGASPKPLGLPEEAAFVGRGVSYCALCDGNFFKGQTVAVVGGGNAALEESLYLSHIVKKLYLIHRRSEYRGARILQEKIAQTPNIEPILKSRVTQLEGHGSLSCVHVENVETGEALQLEVSGLFVFIGYDPQSSFLPLEIRRDPQGFIVTDAEMRTSLPGVFAAGDIRSKLCRQVATAVGDGATAATAAFSYLQQHPLSKS